LYQTFYHFYDDCHSFLTIKEAIYYLDVHTDWRLKGVVAHRKFAVNFSVSMMYAFFTNDAIQTKILRYEQALFLVWNQICNYSEKQALFMLTI
jgi:hypothetical protein